MQGNFPLHMQRILKNVVSYIKQLLALLTFISQKIGIPPVERKSHYPHMCCSEEGERKLMWFL